MEKRFLVGEVKGKDKIVEIGKDLVSIYLCLKLLNNKKKNNKNALDVICDIVPRKYLVESVLEVYKPQNEDILLNFASIKRETFLLKGGVRV